MAGINRTYARRSRLRRPKPLRPNAHVPARNVNSEGTQRPSKRLKHESLKHEKDSVIGQVPLQSSSQADSDNGEDEEEGDSRSEYDADDESDEESVISEKDSTPPTSSCQLLEDDIRSLLEKHPSQIYDSRPPRGYKMLRKPRKSNRLAFRFRAGDGFSGDEARPTTLIPAKRKRIEPVFTMGSLELVPAESLSNIPCDAEQDDDDPAPASTNPGISLEGTEVAETLADIPAEIEPRSPELGGLVMLDRGYGSASQVLGFGFTSPVSIGPRSSPPGEDSEEKEGERGTQRAIPVSPGEQLETEFDRSDMPEIPDSVELPSRGFDQPLLSEAMNDEVVIEGTIEAV